MSTLLRVHAAAGVTTAAQRLALTRLWHMLSREMAMSPVAYQAYALATVQHECAGTWEPITERGPRAYFDKYNAGTPIGARLGNTQLGDGYFFRGRGYVQITGRANYVRLGKHLDLPLADQPDLALQPDIAYAIMSDGMREGLFTGRKLMDHLSGDARDYRAARRIINGLDRADTISAYALRFEAALAA